MFVIISDKKELSEFMFLFVELFNKSIPLAFSFV